MIDSNFINYSKLEPLNVSRETFVELEEYRSLILEKNSEINLISQSTEAISRERHIIDSAQTIDLIDEKCSICTDIGSGPGLPGIVLAIIMKYKKPSLKFNLYEKSHHKSNFLIDMTKKFKLNTEIFKKDIFKEKNLETDLIIARAFKPLEEILKLIHNKTFNYKKFFIFQGKTGNIELLQAAKSWDIEYKQRVSVTSNDSKILEIKNLTKKNIV